MNEAALLEQVVTVARDAGAYIREQRNEFDYASVEQKGLNDLVSHVDRTAERMIVDRLGKLLPEAGFIVEENTLSVKKSVNWIVDPLDGTTNFIHGVPSYAVSIALEKDGDILLGAVYEVSRAECFYARKGYGAFLNGERILVSDRRNLSESLVATGFPIYNFTRLDPFAEALKYLMQHTHGVRRIGAAAVDLCYLAAGRFDAFFEYNLNAWDVAAGALIIKEAGGTVNDFSGGDSWLFGKEIACSNGKVKEEFMEVIRRFFEVES
jgi:myo-inositol-1(or 4)-monophosphatase